jgi:undecaprenyl-diphosphatase
VVAREVRRPAIRAGVVGLAVVLVAVIGLSRLYLGVHWISDVVAGWLLGAAVVVACVTGSLLVTSRSGDDLAATPGAGQRGKPVIGVQR